MKQIDPAGLTNTRRGDLFLIEPVRLETNGRYNWHWKCRCVCGREVVRRQDYLLREGVPHSCGCKSRVRNNDKSHLWKGFGNLDGQYFSTIRARARLMGHELDVTIEQLWELYQKQGGRCALTGAPIGFCGLRQRRRGEGELTASLDRIDSTKGYVEGNVWWVHKDVNRMKNAYPLERFLEVCRLVAARHPGEERVAS